MICDLDVGFPGAGLIWENGGKGKAGCSWWLIGCWFLMVVCTRVVLWGVKNGRLWIILMGKPRAPVDRLPQVDEKREDTKDDFKIVILSSWENGVPVERIQLSEAEPKAGARKQENLGCNC